MSVPFSGAGQAPLCLMTTERSVSAKRLAAFRCFALSFRALKYPWVYKPMDCIMSFSASFMGSLSGSLAEGAPSQSQR